MRALPPDRDPDGGAGSLPLRSTGRGRSGRWPTASLAACLLTSVYVLFVPDPAGGGAGFPGADKVVHLLLFAALAGSARWRLGSSAALVGAVAYAGISEVVQAVLLPDRSGDLMDVVADVVGVVLGWAVAGRLLARSTPG